MSGGFWRVWWGWKGFCWRRLSFLDWREVCRSFREVGVWSLVGEGESGLRGCGGVKYRLGCIVVFGV